MDISEHNVRLYILHFNFSKNIIGVYIYQVSQKKAERSIFVTFLILYIDFFLFHQIKHCTF